MGFTRDLLKWNSDFNFLHRKQQTASANCNIDFLLAINVQTEIIGKKLSACTKYLTFGIVISWGGLVIISVSLSINIIEAIPCVGLSVGPESVLWQNG